MTIRLTDLLDDWAPEFDRRLRGGGLRLETARGPIRLRAAGAPGVAAPPRRAPEPPKSTLRVESAAAVLVGFDRRPKAPKVRQGPTLAAPPPRTGNKVRVISVSKDEPTEAEIKAKEAIQQRIPLERLRGVFSVTPDGAANSAVLAAWFGVPEPGLRTYLDELVEAGDLTKDGESYRLGAGPSGGDGAP